MAGERLLCCSDDLFHWWQWVRDGTPRRSTLRQYPSVVRATTRFVKNILSVIATCRPQGRSVLEHLTACCQAALHGNLPPGPPPVEIG